MNIELRELLAAFAPQQPPTQSPMVGKFCIVRTVAAGVHCGVIQSFDGQTVAISDARRIWRWRGANTLHELSQHGASTEEFTRISEPVDSIVLLDAIEIIPCSEKAAANLRTSRWLS